ncbi:hypothetical protein E2C01_019636 [Portunus trituberculatus]|uniref:Uncharacterized protein n=1 Tax=Portunus trituberculatus TaxID=210409 RepID=A0A5B7DYU8_PORTR|nr:hypothetical protein [Portunus trituberculatus]
MKGGLRIHLLLLARSNPFKPRLTSSTRRRSSISALSFSTSTLAFSISALDLSISALALSISVVALAVSTCFLRSSISKSSFFFVSSVFSLVITEHGRVVPRFRLLSSAEASNGTAGAWLELASLVFAVAWLTSRLFLRSLIAC